MCYIDFHLTPIQHLTTNCVLPKWDVKQLKNDQIKQQYNIYAQQQLNQLLDQLNYADINDNNVDEIYSYLTGTMDGIYNKYLKGDVTLYNPKENLCTVGGLIYYKSLSLQFQDGKRQEIVYFHPMPLPT